MEGSNSGRFGRNLVAVRGGGGGSGIISGGGGGGGGQGQGGDGQNGRPLIMALLTTLGMVWRHYAMLLETKPVITKAITAGFIAVVGDILAQVRKTLGSR